MSGNGNNGADCPQAMSAKRFEALLRQTGRRGIENVLAELGALGFFSAPASARFHGNYPGGLLEHSLNVYDEFIRLLGSYKDDVSDSEESAIRRPFLLHSPDRFRRLFFALFLSVRVQEEFFSFLLDFCSFVWYNNDNKCRNCKNARYVPFFQTA